MGPQQRRLNGEPQAIGDILGRYMRTSGLKEKLRSPEIYNCWPEVAGAEVCRHSRVVGFNNCVLYVEVDSPPWLHMLSTFKKQDLLAGLRQTMRGVRVRDIRFRIGSAAGSAADMEGKPWPKRKKPPTTPETSRSCPA